MEERYFRHVPYRKWCPQCIGDRSTDYDHKETNEKYRRIVEFSSETSIRDGEGVWVSFPSGKRSVTADDNDNDNDTLREVPHLSMRAWPYRQERRGHGPTKKDLS